MVFVRKLSTTRTKVLIQLSQSKNARLFSRAFCGERGINFELLVRRIRKIAQTQRTDQRRVRLKVSSFILTATFGFKKKRSEITLFSPKNSINEFVRILARQLAYVEFRNFKKSINTHLFAYKYVV